MDALKKAITGKSKTINFAMVLAALGAAQVNLKAVQAYIEPELYGWITIGLAVAIAVLRVLTTKPLSEK